MNPTPHADKDKRTAGLLSFLMPGLGQVYLGHYGRGTALFLGFTLLALFSEARFLLPLAAFLAAAEAYRTKRRAAEDPVELPWGLADEPRLKRLFGVVARPRPDSPLRREFIYASVGTLGALGWGLLFASALAPSYSSELNGKGRYLARRVIEFRERTGRLPPSLAEALASDEVVRDPWQMPFELEMTPATGFRIRSYGPDKKRGTYDDYFFDGR